MTIKQILLDFVATVKDEEFSRHSLLTYCSANIEKSSFLNCINALSTIEPLLKDSLVKVDPKVYDTLKFIECLNTVPYDLPDVEQSSTSSNFHIIDGRSDPTQKKIIKTASYRELEELMHPDYPINVYISGETGLGKTTAIVAVAKHIGKPVVRVNLSGATDLDDLLGGIRIVDGNTIFDPGPVAIAMELGAILLLDEVDAGNPTVLIDLHPVLERKGVLLKKARMMIYPENGFCVIATGNSKGQGDATGRYIGVKPMNHAFMQRFGAGIDFVPPTESEMNLILKDSSPHLSCNVRLNLCKWFAHVYDSFVSGAISDYVHVRKMQDIATICLIYGATACGDSAVGKAIRRAMKLSDEALVESFVNLYDTIRDPDLEDTTTELTTNTVTSLGEPLRFDENNEDIPF